MKIRRWFMAVWLTAAMVTSASAEKPRDSDDLWTGILADFQCKPRGVCEVSESTVVFGLVATDGSLAAFDYEGSRQAKAAVATARKRAGSYGALVKGRLDGETLLVDSLQII